MLLVPLLVGLTVLAVAVTARKEMLEAKSDPRQEKGPVEPAAWRSPLAEAFPHLQLWVPSDDAIFQAVHHDAGAKGPDIVLRPARASRQLSDAA